MEHEREKATEAQRKNALADVKVTGSKRQVKLTSFTKQGQIPLPSQQHKAKLATEAIKL